MKNALYKFFSIDQLKWLKRGLIAFRPAARSASPFDFDLVEYGRDDSSPGLSDAEFLQLMQTKYEVLPEQAKRLMDFDYFLEKSASRRNEIEQASSVRVKKSLDIARANEYKGVGLLSLTGKLNLLNHWEHRANQHRGYALEFDATNQYFTGVRYKECPQIFASVKYSDLRPQTGEKNQFPALFCKPQSYAEEEEFRLVRPLSKAKKEFVDDQIEPRYNFDIPLRSIRAIIIGARMPRSQRDEIINFARHEMALKQAVIKESQLDPNNFTLHFVEMTL